MGSLSFHGVMVAALPAWNFTVTDTVAPSYLRMSSSCAASAAEAVAKRKEDECIEIACNYHFFVIAFDDLLLTRPVRLHFCTGPSILYSH